MSVVRARLAGALALVAVLLGVAGPAGAADGDGKLPQLTLALRLFHTASGSLSGNVLAGEGPALGNVVASTDPSTASLAVVALALPDGQVLSSQARLRLVVRESRPGRAPRTLVDRTQSIGAVARGGKAHFGFWLQGTGCAPLQLQATLQAPGLPSVVASAQAPFACNE